jgi:hypothetical protein
VPGLRGGTRSLQANPTKPANRKAGAPKAKTGTKRAAIKKPAAKSTPNAPAAKISVKGDAASKKMQVLDMLRAKDCTTLDELMAATGWQRHTCRGFLSVAGKSMKIKSEKTDSGRRYRIAAR